MSLHLDVGHPHHHKWYLDTCMSKFYLYIRSVWWLYGKHSVYVVHKKFSFDFSVV